MARRCYPPAGRWQARRRARAATAANPRPAGAPRGATRTRASGSGRAGGRARGRRRPRAPRPAPAGAARRRRRASRRGRSPARRWSRTVIVFGATPKRRRLALDRRVDAPPAPSGGTSARARPPPCGIGCRATRAPPRSVGAHARGDHRAHGDGLAAVPGDARPCQPERSGLLPCERALEPAAPSVSGPRRSPAPPYGSRHDELGADPRTRTSPQAARPRRAAQPRPAPLRCAGHRTLAVHGRQTTVVHARQIASRWPTTARPLPSSRAAACRLAVDMLAGRVLSTSLARGTTQVIDIPGPVAATVRPRTAGGIVVATGTRLTRRPRSAGTSVRDRHATRPAHERWRLRPTDASGSAPWPTKGTPDAEHALPRGGRWQLATALEGTTVSNGIDWSDDGATAFYVDSATGRIDTFAFDGAIRQAQRGGRHSPRSGRAWECPDGIAIDAEGGVWVALWDGGARAAVYAPDGTLDAVVPLPCGRVTACSFGGDDLGELFITTSRPGAARRGRSSGGALFRCRPGVRGRAVREFAG